MPDNPASKTRLAQSKYSIFLSTDQSGGLCKISCILAILSANFNTLALSDNKGACKICNCFLSFLGKDLSSDASKTRLAISQPNVLSNCVTVISVSSIMSCSNAEHKIISF